MATSRENLELRMRTVGATASARGVRQVRGEVTKYGRAVDRSNRSSKRLSSTVATMGRYAGIASLGYLGTQAATAFVGFDEGMRNVQSLTQSSEKDIQSLSDSVLKMAGPTAQMPEVLASGLYDLVSSGFAGADALKVLEASAKAATAGLTTTDVSAKTIAAALNAYGYSADKAAWVSDVLFRTVDRGVLQFDDLAQSLGQVMGPARVAGVGLDEVGAAVSTMTKRGIPAAESMVSLRNIMVQIAKPTEAMRAAMDKLGVSSITQLIKKYGGLQGALEALTGTTDGSLEAVSKMFNNQQAARGVFQLTGSGAAKAREDLEAFKKVTGATDRALAQQRKSVSYTIRKIKAYGTALGIRALDKFFRVTKATYEFLKKTMPVWAPLVAVAAAYKTQVLLAAAAQALMAGSGTLMAFMGLLKSVRSLRDMWVLLNMTMAVNPIFLVIALLVGLAVGLYIAYKKVDWFRKGVDAAFKWVKNAVKNTFDWIKDHWPLLLAILGGPFGLAAVAIIKNWDKVKSFFGGLVDFVKSVFSKIVGYFKNKIADLLSVMLSAIHAYNKVAGWATGNIGTEGLEGTIDSLRGGDKKDDKKDGKKPTAKPRGGASSRKPAKLAFPGPQPLVADLTVNLDGKQIAKSTHRQAVKRKATR